MLCLQLYDTVTVIVQQFLRLPSGAAKEELERAKTQLKSQLMMNLEVRPVMFEDLSRQVLGHGYRRKPAEYIRRIGEFSLSFFTLNVASWNNGKVVKGDLQREN